MANSSLAISSPELSGADRLRQERAQYSTRSSSATQSDSDDDIGTFDDELASTGQSASLLYAETAAGSTAVLPRPGVAASAQQDVKASSQAGCNNAVAAAILNMLHDGVTIVLTSNNKHSCTATWFTV